jgi:hypothetical protein
LEIVISIYSKFTFVEFLIGKIDLYFRWGKLENFEENRQIEQHLCSRFRSMATLQTPIPLALGNPATPSDATRDQGLRR